MLTETLLRAQERRTDHESRGSEGRGSEHTDQPQALNTNVHQVSKDFEPFEVINEDAEEGMCTD